MGTFKFPGVAWTLALTIGLPMLAIYMEQFLGNWIYTAAIAGALLMVAKFIEVYRAAVAAEKAQEPVTAAAEAHELATEAADASFTAPASVAVVVKEVQAPPSLLWG